MSDPPVLSLDDLTIPEALRVEEQCSRFERALKAAPGEHRPVLDEYLDGLEGTARLVLRDELRHLELAYPPKPGEGTGVDAYSTRIPGKDLPSVPGYEVLEVLGCGGMGVVYKARDLNLPRMVALKMLLGHRPATPEHLARFRAEAEAVARLQHPHIVQIHAVGEYRLPNSPDAAPFLVLEYIAGGSLAARVRQTPQPIGDAAALIEILARAVHAAHAAGIVHRDLKPANILLAASSPGDSGHCAYGLPKLTDFGLARHLDSTNQSLSREGQVSGTPAYMAPEQALGQSRASGPATDIHALGVILYELLTGRLPFKGATMEDTLRQVCMATVTPPRQLRPEATLRELERLSRHWLEFQEQSWATVTATDWRQLFKEWPQDDRDRLRQILDDANQKVAQLIAAGKAVQGSLADIRRKV
jgi:serine/threonine protein kinase